MESSENGIVNIDDFLYIIANFGPCGTGSGGGGTGIVKLEEMDFSSGFEDETGTVQGDVTAVSNAWSTFDTNWDVYRIWVEVPNSTTYIDAVGASEDNTEPVVLANADDDYFNESTATDYPPNPAIFQYYPNTAFDTFVTLGNATSSGGNPGVQGSLDLTKNTTKEDLTWYKTGGVAPVAGGSTGWRVLVGQFTVPDGEMFSGSLRVVGDGIDDYVAFTSDP